MVLLHLLFLSGLSCCLAEVADRSLPDSEVIIPLSGDTTELPPEEEPASNSDSVNVEEILRELRECRQKNRNLNETIDNILEEMADMKEYIVRNEEEITQVQSSVALMSHDLDGVEDTVERNSVQITNVYEDVVSLTISDQQQGFQIEALTEDVKSLNSTDEQQGIMIEDNIQRLDTLSTRGRWCGYQDVWGTDHSIITYDRYFFTDTNMDVSVTPLDITTGIVYIYE